MTLKDEPRPGVTGLEIDIDIAGNRAVVRVAGELDAYSSFELRDALRDLGEHGVTHVAVDLAEMTFVDSTGLGVLVGALKRLRSVDGDMALVRPSPATRKVLEITGLLSVLNVEPTRADESDC